MAGSRAASLAALDRKGSNDLVLFLHGFGCQKENFAALWDAPELAGVALIAPDLPGHGASHGLAPETWTMQGIAEAVSNTVRPRLAAGGRLHVVAHSMGGAVGLLMARDASLPLASFTNVEGNLVAADCGLLSRRLAEMDLEALLGGRFDKLKASARKSDDAIVQAWAGWLETCAPEALHAEARSLVEWSDGGRLLEIFLELDCPKAYVYGEKSANPEVITHLSQVPQFRIADCGHFVMNERPGELARIIAEVIATAV